jgi:opacity protein-like surface antigen
MFKDCLKRSLLCLMATTAIYVQGYNLDGFYARVGLGYSWAHHPKATCSGATRSNAVPAQALKISGSMPWIGALGYQFSEHWRSEVALNYRSRVNYRFKNDSGEDAKGRLQSLNTMLNIFYDFSVIGNMVPYAGAGVGCAWNKTKKAYWRTFAEGEHRTLTLTWMATVGMREEISKGVWVDGAYRYTNIGRFRNSGNFDNGSYGASTRFKRLNAHEVMLSLIFDL